MTYTYDQVTLSGTATNGTGRLTTATDSAGSRAFFYDALGRTIRTDQTVSGTVYTTQQAFDGIGRRTAVTYPNSLVVKYDYNGGPWLSLVYEGPTAQNPTLAYAQYVGYTAVGQPGSVTFGNGVTTNVTYSQGSNPTCPPATLWLCTLQTTKGTTILQNLTYGYDLAGNVTGLTDPLQGTQTFGYDGLDRLTSATGPWGSHPYAYLPNGNLQTNPLLGTYTYHALTQPGNRPLPHGREKGSGVISQEPVGRPRARNVGSKPRGFAIHTPQGLTGGQEKTPDPFPGVGSAPADGRQARPRRGQFHDRLDGAAEAGLRGRDQRGVGRWCAARAVRRPGDVRGSDHRRRL